MNEQVIIVDEAIKEFESAANAFTGEDVQSIDMNAAFEAIFMIAEYKRRLGAIEEQVNQAMVTSMRMSGEKVHDFGTHKVERKVSSRRKNWQHQTLIEAVINVSLANAEGEVVDILSVAKPLIDNVVKNLTATAAIRDWRVTAVRNIIPGMNPDDFCEVEKSERVSILRK
jgi:hypothetical protein